MVESETPKTKPASNLDRSLYFSVFILTTNTGVAIDFLILFLVYSVCTIVLILTKVASGTVRLLLFNMLASLWVANEVEHHHKKNLPALKYYNRVLGYTNITVPLK